MLNRCTHNDKIFLTPAKGPAAPLIISPKPIVIGERNAQEEEEEEEEKEEEEGEEEEEEEEEREKRKENMQSLQVMLTRP